MGINMQGVYWRGGILGNNGNNIADNKVLKLNIVKKIKKRYKIVFA